MSTTSRLKQQACAAISKEKETSLGLAIAESRGAAAKKRTALAVFPEKSKQPAAHAGPAAADVSVTVPIRLSNKEDSSLSNIMGSMHMAHAYGHGEENVTALGVHPVLSKKRKADNEDAEESPGEAATITVTPKIGCASSFCKGHLQDTSTSVKYSATFCFGCQKQFCLS